MEKITIDIEQKNSNGVLKEYAAKFADLKQGIEIPFDQMEVTLKNKDV